MLLNHSLVILAVASVVAVIAVSTLAAPNKPEPDGGYAFVGFSTAQTAGNIGFAGAAQACQNDFGPGARFATTREYIEPRAVFTRMRKMSRP